MFYQTSLFSYYNSDSSEGKTSRVLYNNLLQKWCESDVDNKKL